jgi:hypothetical protein
MFLSPARDASLTGEAISTDGRFFTPCSAQRGTA